VCPIKIDQTPQYIAPNLSVILSKYFDVFSPPEGLPPQHPIEHSIDLIPDVVLPNAPSYRLAPREIEEIEFQLQQLLNADHIQPCYSPCASPTFIIPKKESGEWHLVTDYRALNKITVKNRYPLLRIKDFLDQLKREKYFTKMDMTTSYHQVCMATTDT
jgi:hypothetical protein